MLFTSVIPTFIISHKCITNYPSTYYIHNIISAFSWTIFLYMHIQKYAIYYLFIHTFSTCRIVIRKFNQRRTIQKYSTGLISTTIRIFPIALRKQKKKIMWIPRTFWRMREGKKIVEVWSLDCWCDFWLRLLEQSSIKK